MPKTARRTSPHASVAWASFHFGRDPYAALIVVYLFGPYFATQVIPDPVRGQQLWGYINVASGIVAAVLAPFFGAIADTAGRRKPWLMVFVAVAVVTIAPLWFARPGEEGLAIVVTTIALALAGSAVSFSVVFHNAMLPSVAPYERLGRVSGLGLAFGNAASIILLCTILYAFALPATGLLDFDWIPDAPLLGLDAGASEPDRIVAPIMALWLLVFTLPFFLRTPDASDAGLSASQAVRRGLADLWRTLRQLRQYKNIVVYLVARMFYNAAVVALFMFSMIYASGLFGWQAAERLLIGIIFNVLAVGGSLLGGRVDDWIGSKKALLITIVGHAVVLAVIVSITAGSVLFIPFEGLDRPVLNGPFFSTPAELVYLCVSLPIAFLLPAAMTSSRTMLARIAPRDEITKFYGIYALSGELTDFIGPLTVAVFTGVFASQRAGMASILLLLISAFALMLLVREERASSAAKGSRAAAGAA